MTYTEEQKQTALTASSRVTRGRWEVVNRVSGASEGFLVGVVPGSRITYDYLADVKRQLSVGIKRKPETTLGAGEIFWDSVDVDTHVLKPWFDIQMPDGGWLTFPKGHYILQVTDNVVTLGDDPTVEVTGFDISILLDRDLTDGTFFSLGAGSVYTTEIRNLLHNAGIFDVLIPDSSATLPVPRKWEQGTKMSVVVNDLLSAINYGSLFFDDNGTARSDPYTVPAQRAVAHTYKDDSASVLYHDATDTTDLWDVPNRWVGIVSTSDRTPLRSVFNNMSPTSETSQVTRGLVVTKLVTDSEAPTQDLLDQAVRKAAHTDSQIFREVGISTLTMPEHGEADIVNLTLSSLGINAENFEEVGWEMCPDLNGQAMTHTLRKVVDVDNT